MSELGRWWCECKGEHDYGKRQGSRVNDSLDVEVWGRVPSAEVERSFERLLM